MKNFITSIGAWWWLVLWLDLKDRTMGSCSGAVLCSNCNYAFASFIFSSPLNKSLKFPITNLLRFIWRKQKDFSIGNLLKLTLIKVVQTSKKLENAWPWSLLNYMIRATSSKVHRKLAYIFCNNGPHTRYELLIYD